VKRRAFTHLHTVCSGDADLTCEEILAAAKERGISVVFLSEHREAMDEAGIARAAAECRELSDDSVLLVPGLEIASDERYHVLGFGLERAVAKGPAVKMAAAIREAGAAPVLAHPTRYRKGWEETLSAFGAVEVWNRHYDGRVSPARSVVRACRAVPGTRAVFGLDAHGAPALEGALPEVVLEVDGPDEAAAIRALREGNFTLALDGCEFDPLAAGGLRPMLGSCYRMLRRAARRVGYLLPFSEATRKKMGRRW
jgi:hypothetical protein